MEFMWDAKKYKKNLEKHHIDFEDAIGVFENDRVEKVDDRKNYGEERIIAVGRMDGLFLTVVYTKRDNMIRIISARKASRDERRNYLSEIGDEEAREN